MSIPLKWRSIAYLKRGSARQQLAWDVLNEARIMEQLASANPILIGTVPIDIDIEGSDLDIACVADDLGGFRALVRTCFGQAMGFRDAFSMAAGGAAYVANFLKGGFEFEIFAQVLPLEQQFGVRHMVVEDRILNLYGSELRQKIRRLKRQGIKTEPAFAQAFGIDHDPYAFLSQLYSKSDSEICALLGDFLPKT